MLHRCVSQHARCGCPTLTSFGRVEQHEEYAGVDQLAIVIGSPGPSDGFGWQRGDVAALGTHLRDLLLPAHHAAAETAEEMAADAERAEDGRPRGYAGRHRRNDRRLARQLASSARSS